MRLSESADYSALLDAQTQAFIKRTEEAFPADAVAADVNRQRELYNAMCAVFRQPYPVGVTSNDSCITGTAGQRIPLRHYCADASSTETPATLIIYLHGGGFVVGSLESHDDVCAEICALTGCNVISVDYRLSPEHKHPAALNDVLDTINNLGSLAKQSFVLCGDSAGANLAASACHHFRQHAPHASDQKTPTVKIAGQVLIYPGLGGDIMQGSYVAHSQAPMLSTQEVEFYANVRCTPHTDRNDWSFAPLNDSNFSDLPPTVVFSAECDPLCDDGKYYCQRIKQANGKAHWFMEDGLVHGYLRARHTVDRAQDSFMRIVDALNALIKNSWHYG